MAQSYGVLEKKAGLFQKLFWKKALLKMGVVGNIFQLCKDPREK